MKTTVKTSRFRIDRNVIWKCADAPERNMNIKHLCCRKQCLSVSRGAAAMWDNGQ